MINPIPLVFSANNYFVPYMSVMMQSIMENAGQQREYRFFVLHQDINANTCDLLNKQISAFPRFSIEFIDVRGFINKYNFFVGTHHAGITIETYFRLLVPEIFSALGYEKVIYVDGDMICLTDISKLFNIDIEFQSMAAARDIMGIGCYYSGAYEKMSRYSDGKTIIKNIDNYFNAGIIIFNIKQFMSKYSTEYLLDFAVSKKWRCHDQDILNVLYEDNFLLLPMKWNYTEEENMELYAPPAIQDEYFEAKKSPNIIHYCKNKPWKVFFYGANFHYFWLYASRTPFLKIALERMQQEGLISSTSYNKNLLKDVKMGNGPGGSLLLKCAFIKGISKLQNVFYSR